MQRLTRYLLASLPMMVALTLYSYVIHLPFFLDDGIHFAMIKDYPAYGVPGLRFWGGAISFPYFRPAVFTIWEIQQILVGHFDTVGLHLFNVFCFGLAGVTLTAIVRRMTHSLLAGVIAGLVFVLFPFNFAAVILVAALFHLMLALCAMLAVLGAFMWLDGRRGVSGLILCWCAAFVGIFSHENGILMLPLLGMLIVINYGYKTLFQRKTLLLPIVAIIGIYLYLWATVPRAAGPPEFNNGFLASLAIFLQGLVYPFPALIRALTCAAGTCAQGDRSLLLILTVVVVVAIGLLLIWRGRSLRPLIIASYGLLWYIVGALPSALLLAPDYVAGSPRLMMFSSLGAGIFWGAALGTLLNLDYPARKQSLQTIRKSIPYAVALSVILLGLIVSVRFLSARRNDALVQGEYTWRLMELIQAQETQNSTPLVINAPAFLAPAEATFLTGAEGVIFMDAYVNYAQQFWAQTGQEFPLTQALSYDQTLRIPRGIVYRPYHTDATGTFNERLHAASHIYATYFDGADFRPVYVGGANLPGSDEAIAIFGTNEIELTEWRVNFSQERQIVSVLTRWRVNVPQAAKPFIHVRCGDEMVGQLDAAIWGETYPFSAWQAGEIQTDIREIRLIRQITDTDCLRLFIGVYRESDITRLIATNPDNVRFPDDLVEFYGVVALSEALFAFSN